MQRIRVGLLGTGNIGTDLLIKISNKSKCLEVGMFSGIDPESEGIGRARQMGIPASADGINAALAKARIEWWVS